MPIEPTCCPMSGGGKENTYQIRVIMRDHLPARFGSFLWLSVGRFDMLAYAS